MGYDMIFYKCYGNHDKNKDIDVDKLPEKERKYYVFDINNNNDIVRDNDDYEQKYRMSYMPQQKTSCSRINTLLV